VSLANSFIPLAGNSIHILNLGTVSGACTSVSLPALLPGLSWNTSQLYSDGILRVVSAGLSGDYNNNGIVDAADYTVWRDSLGQSVSAFAGADGNGDGMIDAGDYDLWRTHFGQRAGNGSESDGAVAEPSTLMLFATVCVAACACRRRRCIRCPTTHIRPASPNLARHFLSLNSAEFGCY
jgi:hypothetical protein